jgi:hypothetical protein
MNRRPFHMSFCHLQYIIPGVPCTTGSERDGSPVDTVALTSATDPRGLRLRDNGVYKAFRLS